MEIVKHLQWNLPVDRPHRRVVSFKLGFGRLYGRRHQGRLRRADPAHPSFSAGRIDEGARVSRDRVPPTGPARGIRAARDSGVRL